MLPIWGGTEHKYLVKIQTIINKTARFVTDLGIRVSTRTLMEALYWLDITEMMELHTLVSLWKVIWLGCPLYMYRKINYNIDTGNVSTIAPRLQNTLSSFRWRSCQLWNDLPIELKKQQTLPAFKNQLRKWIINKRDRQPD